MKMTRRRLSPEERKKEILQAAAREFAARPYEEVQIDEIARRADASRALINHYYGDKKGLFLALAREAVERIPSAVRTDLDLPVEEMVAANTATWLDLVEAGRETFLRYFGSGPIARDPRLEALLDELRDRIAERMLSNHLGADAITPEARIAMRAELALIERALHDWASGRGGSRAQTQALISQSILSTIREVLPAVQAA